MKRICSSSTLIAGDLAKRSPIDSRQTSVEVYNSCASSISPQVFLPITNGESNPDELAEMMWNTNSGEQGKQIQTGDSSDNMNTSRGPCSPGYCSPNGGHDQVLASGRMDCETGDQGGYTQELGLVHQVHMPALWNE